MKKIITRTASLMLFILFVSAGYGQANTSLSNLSSPTAANQSLLPDANNKRNLGSASKSWRILYLDSAIYLKDSLFIHRRGTNNTFVGENAGKAISSAANNTAVGYNALSHNGSGNYNAAMGSYALYSNNNGSQNSAFGHRALYFNTTGYYNIALGAYTLYNNITGGDNIAIGVNALYNHKKGNYNIAIGSGALQNDTSGYDNLAMGRGSLFSNSNGFQNTAMGSSALYHTGTGYNNCAFGYHAGYDHKGNNNTFVGAYANPTADVSNSTAIGSGASVTASNQVRLGNTQITSVVTASNVYLYSDGRFKRDIKEDVPGLAFINKLRPVTYHYNIHQMNNHIFSGMSKTTPNDLNNVNVSAQENLLKQQEEESMQAKEKILYTGFVAQDVERAAKEINYDFSGIYKPANESDVYALSYTDFVVPLIKAVQELDENQKSELKNHNEKIALLQNENDELRKEIDELKMMIGGLNTSSVNNQQKTSPLQSAKLEQNQPNPSTQSTTIRYFIPDKVLNAAIKITNASGQTIKSINLSQKGSTQIKIQTGDIAGGTYFYSLIVDGKTINTKKMIIERN